MNQEAVDQEFGRAMEYQAIAAEFRDAVFHRALKISTDLNARAIPPDSKERILLVSKHEMELGIKAMRAHNEMGLEHKEFPTICGLRLSSRDSQ